MYMNGCSQWWTQGELSPNYTSSSSVFWFWPTGLLLWRVRVNHELARSTRQMVMLLYTVDSWYANKQQFNTTYQLNCMCMLQWCLVVFTFFHDWNVTKRLSMIETRQCLGGFLTIPLKFNHGWKPTMFHREIHRLEYIINVISVLVLDPPCLLAHSLIYSWMQSLYWLSRYCSEVAGHWQSSWLL